MSSIFVKDGTPVGSRYLCKTCEWGQFTSGYRESDLMVVCMRGEPTRLVPFVVNQCNEFRDRSHPNWDQMEELAITLTEPRKPTRGFSGFGFGQADLDTDDDKESLE